MSFALGMACLQSPAQSQEAQDQDTQNQTASTQTNETDSALKSKLRGRLGSAERLGRDENPFLPPWSYGSKIITAKGDNFLHSPTEPLLSFFDCNQVKSTIEIAICSFESSREAYTSIIRRVNEILSVTSGREREQLLQSYTDWYSKVNDDCTSIHYQPVRGQYLENTSLAIVMDCALNYAFEWNASLQSNYSDKLSSLQILIEDDIEITLDENTEYGKRERFDTGESYTSFRIKRSHPIFGGLLPYYPEPDFSDPMRVLASMSERRDRIGLVASYTHNQGYFLSLRARDRTIVRYDACIGAMQNVKTSANQAYNPGFANQQWLICADGMADVVVEITQLAKTYEYLAETNKKR